MVSPLIGDAQGRYRVHLVGNSGSGKTTVGKELAQMLNVPFISLDTLYFTPGWGTSPQASCARSSRPRSLARQTAGSSTGTTATASATSMHRHHLARPSAAAVLPARVRAHGPGAAGPPPAVQPGVLRALRADVLLAREHPVVVSHAPLPRAPPRARADASAWDRWRNASWRAEDAADRWMGRRASDVAGGDPAHGEERVAHGCISAQYVVLDHLYLVPRDEDRLVLARTFPCRTGSIVQLISEIRSTCLCSHSRILRSHKARSATSRPRIQDLCSSTPSHVIYTQPPRTKPLIWRSIYHPHHLYLAENEHPFAPTSPMAFRKDRVRVVAVYNVPQASAQNFEPRFSEALEAFIRLPLVQKNILKFEISIANEGFDTTARSLGLQKPSFNSVVILEAETHEKINEIISDPGFQKLFKAANDAGDFDTNTSIVFAADFMASIDK